MSQERLNAYHIMWLFVFFDLPVVTKKERKYAAKFRKNIMENGFTMMQYSVYMRHCASYEALQVHKNRVKKIMPPAGNVSLLAVTDKQFSEIENYFGKEKQIEHPHLVPTQLELF